LSSKALRPCLVVFFKLSPKISSTTFLPFCQPATKVVLTFSFLHFDFLHTLFAGLLLFCWDKVLMGSSVPKECAGSTHFDAK